MTPKSIFRAYANLYLSRASLTSFCDNPQKAGAGTCCPGTSVTATINWS